MKRHLPSAICHLLLAALLSTLDARLSTSAAGTFACEWNFVDFVGEAQVTNKVYITPIAAYGVNAATIVTGDRRAYTNRTSSLIVSNLVNGRSYRVEFIGRYVTTTITNSFDTNVTGLVNGADPAYLTVPVRDTATVAFSQAAADARFHKKTGDTSTNATFRGTVKIPAGATVGHVFTVTNADGSGAWQAPASGLDTNAVQQLTVAGSTNASTATNAPDGNAIPTRTALAAGTVPVAASALTGTVTASALSGGAVTAVNSIAATNVADYATNYLGQYKLRSLDITNGGWVTQFGTNWDGATSNFTIGAYPQIPGTTPGGGWRLAVGTSAGDKSFMDFWLNTRHDTETPNLRGAELQIAVGGNIAIAPGYGSGVIKHLQKGIGPKNPREGGGTWNPWSYGQRIAPFGYEPGYTWADAYRIDLLSGAQKFPAFIARQWTNDAGFGERWEISILKDLGVTFVANTNGYTEDRWAISNVVDGAGYYVYSSGALEGFYHRGAFLQSLDAAAPATTNVLLDFGKAAAVTVRPSPLLWNMVTTNSVAYSTNYQRCVFIFPGGLMATNITYPSWRVPTNFTLPTFIPPSYFMRLELESVGFGETNKIVSNLTLGPDPTFTWDSDAADFFVRTGGLESAVRSNAINRLVLNLKMTNLFTLVDAFYPYAGTTDRINTNNLKSSSFGGVFTGSPAFTDGFVADGSNDYMATGFIPSSAGGNYTQDSAHVAAYTESTTMDDNDRLIGVYDSAGGIKGVMIRRNSTTMQVHGPNNNTYTTGAAHGGDYTGFMCGSRVDSSTAWIQVRSTQASGASTSSALPTKQIYIGGLNNDGTAASFTAASYRCVSIGGGLTAAQMNALKWCMEQYVSMMP